MKWVEIEFDKNNHSHICGLGVQVGRWSKSWHIPESSPFHIWVYVFPRDRLEPPHLVHNFDDDYNDYVRIGMVFPHKGRMAKVAIRLENDLTPEELKKGIITLAKSVGEPEKPGSGVIFDHGIMRGKEIKIRCKEK